MREVEDVTKDENGDERHPAFALVGASRVSSGHPGQVLFDSEIRHQHYVVVTLRTAVRQRSLNHDRIHPDHGRAASRLVEFAMSEAQWASFVSSMNTGNGVPCTLQGREGDPILPGLPYAPRLQESLNEVRTAGDKALEEIREAFAAAEAKPTKANLRTLKYAIQNAVPNMEFAAKSLDEQAENTVQKARADLEAMAELAAERVGLESGHLRSALGLPEHAEGGGRDA